MTIQESPNSQAKFSFRYRGHRTGVHTDLHTGKFTQGVLVAAARAPRERQRAVGREGESTDRALEAWLRGITARAATIGCTSADINTSAGTVADLYAASQ